MAVNQLAVRMAGRDIETALQYINLAISVLDRGECTLSVESGFNDPTLKRPAAQAKSLLRQTKHLAEAFDGMNIKPLTTYTPAEQMEAACA